MHATETPPMVVLRPMVNYLGALNHGLNLLEDDSEILSRFAQPLIFDSPAPTTLPHPSPLLFMFIIRFN